MVYLGSPYLEYTEEEDVIEDVKQHIQDLHSYMVFEGLDFTIVGYEVVGSRTNKTCKPESDLDVKLRYIGDADEDAMFNCLNDPDNALYIANVRVDFIPINENS